MSSSISTKTGVAPTFNMLSTVAKKVNDGMIIWSPFFIPSDIRLSNKASVPEFTDIEYLLPTWFLKLFSKLLTSLPPT